MLTLTLLSLLSLSLGTPNPKRGFVGDGCKGAACQDVALLTAAGWYYAVSAGLGVPAIYFPFFPPHPLN